MTHPFDTFVAQAVYQARLAERALHDAGPWRLALGPVVVPAVREIGEDEIIFQTVFAPQCFLSECDGLLRLYCRDELVAVRSLDIQNTVGVELAISWSLRLALTQTTVVR